MLCSRPQTTPSPPFDLDLETLSRRDFSFVLELCATKEFFSIECSSPSYSSVLILLTIPIHSTAQLVCWSLGHLNSLLCEPNSALVCKHLRKTSARPFLQVVTCTDPVTWHVHPVHLSWCRGPLTVSSMKSCRAFSFLSVWSLWRCLLICSSSLMQHNALLAASSYMLQWLGLP